MAQFDVHRNLGRLRAEVPFVVVAQSSRFQRSSHRVVLPLVRSSIFTGRESDLQPEFAVEGVAVVLDPLQMAAVAVDRLGPVVANLSGEGDRIIRAIDLLISRAHG